MAEQGKYFSPEAFPGLAAVEDTSWWFRSRNQVIIWAFRKFVGSFNDYLEIGCGTGFVLREVHRIFPKAKILGTEYFEQALVFAKSRVPAVNFQQLDATKMSFNDEFDVVGMFDVLEHVEEDSLVLQNIWRSLAPQGKLILTVPQHLWMWSPADDYALHVRRYSNRELTSKVESAGFKIDYRGSFVSLLFPLMVVARFRSRHREFDPEGEFRTTKIANAVLMFVMKIELHLLKVGIRFPSGGSILLVASKV